MTGWDFICRELIGTHTHILSLSTIQGYWLNCRKKYTLYCVKEIADFYVKECTDEDEDLKYILKNCLADYNLGLRCRKVSALLYMKLKTLRLIFKD